MPAADGADSPGGSSVRRNGIRSTWWTLAATAAAVALATWFTATHRAAGPRPFYDVVIRGGTVYDGTGAPGRRADVGIRGDRIAALGDLSRARAARVIDARGLAVAPGFINMLSWSGESLLVDGRAQSTIRQGVTTEVMGEGASMGPLNAGMARRLIERQGEWRFDVTWRTLGEYLSALERRGIATNVASFVGAATLREHVVGLDDRPATDQEIAAMQDLVAREMEAGALGIGSSLIYPPGAYASTEELIALCRVAARYRGKYISHLRSEGDRLIEAVDELIRISREANIPAEIYHLKAAGQANWPKMPAVLERIEAARRAGLAITADMYVYPAGATGLDAAVPPAAQDGGFDAFLERLADPVQRAAIAQEMREPATSWESLYHAAGSPERVLFAGFRTPPLRRYIGRTLADIARERGRDPIETILDLFVEERSSPSTVYFMMSEENIRLQLRRPWVSLGSDAASMSAEGVFLSSSTHPRAYGNFARFLGKYVREERLLPLAEAIRRMTGLPAANLGLVGRGLLKPDWFADITVFDPETIADRATFEDPHQYSVGVRHVFVNGVQVLDEGEHTGALPGRALRGPGAVESEVRRTQTAHLSSPAWPELRGEAVFVTIVDGQGNAEFRMQNAETETP
ncbi:MAG TPA: D-aminoacylase [Vicinamibacterales bacterium]